MRLLSDNATVVISGTRIAEELGTSRSEVWRAVQHLRELGVQIAGHPSTGYQLEAVPDLLLPDILAPLAERHYLRLAHSSLLSHRLDQRHRNAVAATGEPEGAVFVAEQQTAGRGRGGHSWDRRSRSESTARSCCVRRSPGDALLLSLIAGIAVAEAVEQTTGLHPDLRWPNDVLLDGRKFCGILTEMNAEPTRVRYVVIGIGINVNHASFTGELEPIATSLRMESGRSGRALQLTAALLKSLDNEYRKFRRRRAGSAARILWRFEARSSFARSRQCSRRHGGYEGVTEGLDDRGFLLVRTEPGLRTVLSGVSARARMENRSCC